MPRRSPCLTLAAATAASLAWGGPPSLPPPPRRPRRRAGRSPPSSTPTSGSTCSRRAFPGASTRSTAAFTSATRATGPRSQTARASSSTRRGSSWTAATVARLRPEAREEYLGYARHGVRYLADVMWDRAHGGFHTHVDPAGRPTSGEERDARPVYGQAFAVYAPRRGARGERRPGAPRARAAGLAVDRGPLPRRPRPRLPQRGGRRLDRRSRRPPHDERPHPPPRGVRGAAAVLAGPGAAEAHRGAARLRPRPAVHRAGLPLHCAAAGRARRARAGLVRPRRGDGLPDDRGRGGPRPRAVGRHPARGAHARGPRARARLRPRPRAALRVTAARSARRSTGRSSGGPSSRPSMPSS